VDGDLTAVPAALVRVAFVTVLFCLTQSNPVDVAPSTTRPFALVCVLGPASLW
jgi:hypothetical protein